MNKTNLSKVQQETFDPAILNDIEGYWNERSKTFSETRKKEMSGSALLCPKQTIRTFLQMYTTSAMT